MSILKIFRSIVITYGKGMHQKIEKEAENNLKKRLKIEKEAENSPF